MSAPKAKTGPKPMTGRKFRNLSNGKWYTTKRQSASADLRSAKAKARVDPELIMKCTLANQNEESIRKRTESLKKYIKRKPGFRSAMMQNVHRLHPWMKEHASRLAFSRDGVLVLKKVMCERERSVGVNRYEL